MTEPSGLGPMGDVHLIAQTLRADRAEIASCTRVLTTVLRDALPDGMVTVQRHRTLADRLAGRDGEPVALVVRTDDQELELHQRGHARVTAEIRHVVRAVVIRREHVTVDEWLVALASVLADLARDSARARAALGDLLGG